MRNWRNNMLIDDSNKKIVIAIDPVSGLGDIAAGFRIADTLINSKIISIKQLILVIKADEDEESTKKANEIFNDKKIRVISSKKVDEELKDDVFVLQIHFPNLVSTIYSQFLKRNVPILQIEEYDLPPFRYPKEFNNWVVSHSFGLNNKYLGIFIDEELKQWGFSKEAFDPIKRLENLEKLPIKLQKAILGESYSTQGMLKFAKTNKLYFGYCSDLDFFKHFILAFTLINKKEKLNITLVTPLNINSKNLSEENKENIDFLSRIKRMGFHQIQISNLKNDEVDTIILIEQLDESKNKRIFKIITGEIKKCDVQILLMSSEKETVVTGDQSLTNGISNNMNFIYETLPHKNKLAEQINGLISLNNEDSTNDYRPPICLDISDVDDQFFFYKEIYNSFFWGIKNQDLVTKLNKDICDNRNCNEKLTDIVKSLLDRTEDNEPLITFLEDEDLNNKTTPYNKIMFLTSNQIRKLQISTQTSQSKIEEFGDSFFSYLALQNDFLVLRN